MTVISRTICFDRVYVVSTTLQVQLISALDRASRRYASPDEALFLFPRGRAGSCGGRYHDVMPDEGLEDIRPSTPVAALEGVGKARAAKLNRLGIATVGDLIRHLPMRYERQFAEGAIEDLTLDQVCTARGHVVAARYVQGRKGRFEVTLQDHSGTLNLSWFNAGYLRSRIHAGMVLRVQGKVGAFNGYPQIVNPRWEVLDESEKPVEARDERLRPVYPATEDLTSLTLEQLISRVLPEVIDQLTDPLPPALIKAHNMPVLADAFRMAHSPEHEEEAGAARRRLAFNELLLMQIGIAIKKHYNRTTLKSPALPWNKAIDEHIRKLFGFELTDAQNKVVAEIAADLQRSHPMNRLLQGDVGAGKTVVALYALLMAVFDRTQAALMAPTELLAEQHFLSISRMLEGSNVRLLLLTKGTPNRAEVERQIEAGEVDIVIGTQALLTESVRFSNLALVVVDEQHRFGVLQRAAFRGRGGEEHRSPHYLVMTATPIPRTLSLTIFGDLDVSTITALPPGRTPIVTRVVPPENSDNVYRYMAEQVEKGRQAYVVVPTIDESGAERTAHLKNVTAHVKLLQDKYCQGQKVVAIHGRLKRDSRESIMTRFRAGKIDVLVATTVIEVGVDVPNATMMVVEHAERFGLAQLHQLRGRIGRGSHGHRSVCAFIAAPETEEATNRMKAIGSTNDGFRIAEHDLEIRGMGDFFGTRQHGLPPLRVARIPQDMDLLQLSKRDAEDVVAADPNLAKPEHLLLRKVLIQQYGDTLGLIDVG